MPQYSSGVDTGHPNAAFAGFDSKALLHTFLEQLGTALVLCNAVGKITLVNAAARQLAQRDPEGALLRVAPSVWGEMFDEQGRGIPVAEWPWIRALHGQTVLPCEYRLVRRNGEYTDVLFGAYPIRDQRSTTAGVLSSLTNITQHKSKELALRHDAIMNERSRMAGEIHDTLVQGLNAVLLQLETVSKEFKISYGQGEQRLRQLREIARENLSEARRTIWQLSSESLHNEDPALALAFVARKLFEGVAVELQLHLQKEVHELSPDVRIELLRIGKEALANVLRHARASQVRVDLAYIDGMVRLSIADNGRGFNLSPRFIAHHGFGLTSMRMRAERIGGKLSIHSRPGRGTRIVATVPLSSYGRSHAAHAAR
jgi:signal transduction histidine kinase